MNPVAMNIINPWIENWPSQQPPVLKFCTLSPPRWLSGEPVGLMTWWLWLPAFSPFPTMFSEGLFLRVI